MWHPKRICYEMLLMLNDGGRTTENQKVIVYLYRFCYVKVIIKAKDIFI